VANKVRGTEDEDFIKNNIGGLKLAGSISFSSKIMEADMKGSSPYLYSPETVNDVKNIKESIEKSF
jgi:CO dehydrogenase nickel-insertion accessory protein CooC1